MPKNVLRILQVLIHIGALAPLALLAWDFSQGHLTANPIREIELRTGIQTLVLLTFTLACRPVYTFTGIGYFLPLRRLLGLYTFLYASLHLLTFMGLDYSFNFRLLWKDIADKRYIIAGFGAFLMLLLLAITSTRGWIKRLGPNWQRLHRLIYAAGILAVLHYLWQIKVAMLAPLVFEIMIVLLLLLRIPYISRKLTGILRWHSRKPEDTRI